MDRVRIPHDPGPRKSYVAPAPAWGRDLRGHLFFRCICGLCLSLDAGHAIGPTGDITPSIHHDDPACGYHIDATLEGWRR